MSDLSYLESLKKIAVALGTSQTDADEAVTVLDSIKLIAKAHGATDENLKSVTTISAGLKAVADSMTNSGLGVS